MFTTVEKLLCCQIAHRPKGKAGLQTGYQSIAA